MKKKFSLGLMLTLLTTLASSLFFRADSLRSQALDNFVDGEGNVHYGWSLVANEINQSVWEFDEEGQVSYIYAAEGDTANQRIFNYAMRNLEVSADADYTMSATFTPDPESDLSVERSYGIVAWYQDADNYLIYWLQQKIDGAWSGQFYGRIDGAFRKMWVPAEYGGPIPTTDYWLKGEYYDMWWDSKYAHSSLRNQRNMLLTEPITMHVVSTLDEATVAGVTKTCRRFELRQTVRDIEEVICVFYVEQVDATSGNFFTGLYSEAFNVGVSNFTLNVQGNTFAADVETLIDALPNSVTADHQIDAVIEARDAYETLLNFKTDVASAHVEKLESVEASVGTYVDGLILALDKNDATFVEDVNSVVTLYSSLPEYLADYVTEVEALLQAIEDAQNWGISSEEVSESDISSETSHSQSSTDSESSQPPVSSEPTSTSEPTSGGGCGGSIVGASSIFLFSIVLVGALALRSKSKRDE